MQASRTIDLERVNDKKAEYLTIEEASRYIGFKIKDSRSYYE